MRRLVPPVRAVALALAAVTALMLAAAPVRAQTAIPDDCVRWFDGCNTCTRNPAGGITCTLKQCTDANRPPAICLQRTGDRQPIPKDCAVWFDGCNTCRRGNGRTVICTRRYCSTRGEARCIRKIGE